MLRDYALENQAFRELYRVWLDRGNGEAAAHRARGGRVVGCLGADVPEEYLLAGDLLPLRIAPDPRSDLAHADR